MKSTILLVFILHSICSIGKPNLNLFAKLNKNPISQVENKKSPNFIKSKTHYEYSSGGDISIGNLDSFLYDNQGNLITTSMYNWDYYNGFTYSGKKNNIYQNDLLYYAYETDAIGDTILITSYFYDQNGNDTLEQNKILFKGAFFASYGERIKIIPKNSGSYIIHTSLDWDSIHQKLINDG